MLAIKNREEPYNHGGVQGAMKQRNVVDEANELSSHVLVFDSQGRHDRSPIKNLPLLKEDQQT